MLEEAPCAVALQRLEDHARGDSAGDARLHHRRGLQVPRQAPDHAREPLVAVVPAAVGAAAHGEALQLEGLRHLRPQRIELARLLARPSVADALVQVALPLRVSLILVDRNAAPGDQASRAPDRPIESVAGLAERQTHCSDRPSDPRRQGGELGVVAAGV